MKKIKWFALLGCLISLLALPGMAEEASLPAIRITYTADVELSQEEAVEAQVVLEDAGEETSLEAQLRLHDSTLDVVETALPQKSLRVKRGEIRKQAKSLKSSRLWTAGKQVTTE